MATLGTTRRELTALAGAATLAVLADGVLRPRPAAARLSRRMPRDMVQLNSNESPYGPTAAARAAMTAAQEVGARYPGDLEEEVRAALAAFHRVGEEQILLGCGSGEILRMAGAAFLGAGRTLVVAEPTFEAVLMYAGVVGGEPVRVPLDGGHRHDLAAMARACDGRTGLVYVCNPNNPTSTVHATDDLAAFLRKVPDTAAVLVDEAYIDFVEASGVTTLVDRLAAHPALIVVRTFSKIHGLAGMRLGYAVGSAGRIAALRRHAVVNNANAAVLAAALASQADTAALSEVRRRMNDTRRALCAELERDGRRFIPPHANFVMIDVGRDVAPVIAAFRERKILVGRKFPTMPTWLRVSVGTERETAAFAAALREIVPPAAAPA
jgi:histidinol-phosphate aminotransferase